MSEVNTIPPPTAAASGHWTERFAGPVIFVIVTLIAIGVYLAFQIPVAVFPSTDFPRIVVGVDNGVAPINQMQVTVTALTELNDTAVGYTGTVHFTSTDTQALLPANTTLVNGVGVFSATLITAGTQTLTATDTLTRSITGGSTNITVNPAPASRFSLSAPSTATAGSALIFTVTALDAFNNTASGYGGSVHFSSSDSQAVLPANSTLTNGVGTFSATLKTPGSQTVTATDAGHSGLGGSTAVTRVLPCACSAIALSRASRAIEELNAPHRPRSAEHTTKRCTSSRPVPPSIRGFCMPLPSAAAMRASICSIRSA